MNKKKATDPPAKMKRITIRVTPKMYDVICTDAKSAHLPIAGYTRQLLSNRRPAVHNEIVYNDPELLKVLGDMGKIGSNLNQIARYLNEGVDPTGEIMKEVMRCIAELQKM